MLRRGAPADFANPVEPTDAMTVTRYGLTAFEVQDWDGSAWFTVPGGGVTGDNRIKRTFTFAPPTTDRVGVLVSNAPAGYSRLTEVEVYSFSPQGDGETAPGNYGNRRRIDKETGDVQKSDRVRGGRRTGANPSRGGRLGRD